MRTSIVKPRSFPHTWWGSRRSRRAPVDVASARERSPAAYKRSEGLVVRVVSTTLRRQQQAAMTLKCSRRVIGRKSKTGFVNGSEDQ